MIQTSAQPIYLKDYVVPAFFISHVNLVFDLGDNFTIVTSELAIVQNPDYKLENTALRLDGEALELLSLSLDGRELKQTEYETTEQGLTIFHVPNQFLLNVVTRIKPNLNKMLSGLYQSQGNFCTQCEAEGFRRITYFLDRPDVMARFVTTIIADEKRFPVLLSNGNMIEKKKLDKGRHQVTWEDPFKKPCYLFALVAGDLDKRDDVFVTSSGKPITLSLYVEKGNLDKCEHAMQSLKKAMRWDEETFGREYDLDLYMIVAVSDFNMGAMENKGLNIFNTCYILANPETATDQDYVHIESVIGHEYFHNWTGNRITCRDWFQLSLKEGLTVFREQCFTADMTSKTVARIHDVNALRQSQFPEDGGPLAHPVQPLSYIEINNFYTSTIYNKGAEVIRMQQTILGKRLFRQAMDLYFERYDGEAITIDAFVKAMEDASQIDLSQFRLWYSQAGTPCLDVHDHYDENTKTYTLDIKQTCPDTPHQFHKKPFFIPIKMGLLNASGDEIRRDILHLKEEKQHFEFYDVPERPVLSLLRDFSAPVKLQYAYSDHDLQLLFQHDTDLFNRWEAGQTISLRLLLRLVDDFQKNKPLRISNDYFSTLRHVMRTMQHDRLLLAECLTLPSEKYIAEQMTVIDVDAIRIVRDFVLVNIAHELKDLFLEGFQQHNDLSKPYSYDLKAMGLRCFSNMCLSYLAKLEDETIYHTMIVPQFKKAFSHNMTDTMAALRCIVNSKAFLSERDLALNVFYERWKSDALVVDKWLMVQASSTLPDTLSRVMALLKHPAFDIKNPNKVYALIGSFCQNRVSFHAETGEGYVFLADRIIELNAFNPQIAARMVTPFSEWRRFDAKRQALIQQQLMRILELKTISKDVSELVTKSLQ